MHNGYICIRQLSKLRICVRACTFPSDLTLFLSLQVESGKLLLEEADFDLNKELEGLVDMFSVQCIDHNIEIVLDLAGNSFSRGLCSFRISKRAHTFDMPQILKVNMLLQCANGSGLILTVQMTCRGWSEEIQHEQYRYLQT